MFGNVEPFLMRSIASKYLISRAQTAFFSFCVGAEKKGSGGNLCSQIYNFWGLLITADEQQRPANEARMEKRRRSGCTDLFLRPHTKRKKSGLGTPDMLPNTCCWKEVWLSARQTALFTVFE